MRYATIAIENEHRLAQVGEDGNWRPALDGTTLRDLIEGQLPAAFGDPVPEPDFVLPYRPPTIYGIGLNFYDTVRDMGWDAPEQPYLFPKLSSSACGPYDDIVVDETLTTRADWEAELAVVIGQQVRNLAPESTSTAIFGYTAANDISARDLQAADGQWLRGKGLDTFCPLGPAVVTADEIPDPQNVGIRTWLDGELVQDGNTADMIFTIAELISYCSRHFTLYPGDMILTGTPAGCGDFRNPPIALRPGNIVEVEVAGIGRHRNKVAAPGKPAGAGADSISN
ncbi:fumarylacetoacetate hydrolase family protein [Nocardia testacea]|uniref:Fumarylacetoacetate hydrolase family protein n=1 Tax=Nocardia testacea TaxID=248551 RepID=A0ABW7VV63_9NOCA